jgi:hypothetical protein
MLKAILDFIAQSLLQTVTNDEEHNTNVLNYYESIIGHFTGARYVEVV